MGRLISEKYAAWKQECEDRFQQLKKNEEELNRIFIDIYGLQDELTPDVADKDVTVHRVFDSKDAVPESMKGSNYVRTMRDEIVSLISYAAGCMFGRYSLDVDGLAYAGGEWDASKYKTIIPDSDNIIPICDDEYFDDDITGRFVEFVRKVYGDDTLEENLKFVADALGGRGTPREEIRSYFLNDFYADHCKTYQKRPIYWLFDSGKKNGFKALVYMHRYQRDLLARLRTDYVHEQQERYRTQLAQIGDAIDRASASERVKLTKQQKVWHDRNKLRDLAIVVTLLGTGVRVTELVGLDISDLDFDNGAMRVIRKGGNEDIVYFGEEVEEMLRNYLDERLLMEPEPGNENALFISQRNTRITVRSVERLVKKYASTATVKKITPHKLRSTYGTTLYQETGDIYLVADVLGHKNVNTTRKHYAAMKEDNKRKAARIVQLREKE